MTRGRRDEDPSGPDPTAAGPGAESDDSLGDVVDGLLALHAKLRDEFSESASGPAHAPRVAIPEDAPRLGSYFLLGPLGRGAMGEVYRAAHPDLDREVALKILASHVSLMPDRIRLFRREAALAAGLVHPAIVRIHEVDCADNTWFYTMDLVEGRSLDDVLGALRAVGERPIGDLHRSVLAPNVEDAGPAFATAGERYALACARLVTRLADAVDHAHGKGVIHRDLKPSNILLTKQGLPKITDFGLATRIDTGDDRMTRMGVGTPHYMAPEAFRAIGTPAPALDVYALGVLLYELLTLRLPFEGKTVFELPAAIEARANPPAHRSNPAVDSRLSGIVDRALEPDPAARLGSAGKLRELLDLYVGQLTIPELPAPRISRWWRRVRRNPWKYAAIAFGVLALAEWIWIVLG